MKSKVIVILIVIIAIGVGTFFYLRSKIDKSNMQTDQNTAANSKWSADQQKAITLANQELEKHFPGGKSFGISYQPVSVIAQSGPSNTLNEIYVVSYMLLGGPTDQDVWITVDITANRIIQFERVVQ